MGLNLNYKDGQTPLDDDDKNGLKIKSISTRQELDEFEQQNIEDTRLWLLRKKVSKETYFSEKFIKELHAKMFGSVWLWAGKFRQKDTNLGVDWRNISVEIKKLLDNCLFWIENKTYSEEEIAIRFKHRLVSIHPFPNGNGRHCRLMADIMMEKIFNKKPFSWGGETTHINEERDDYLKALREADNNNFIPLLKFARSNKNTA